MLTAIRSYPAIPILDKMTESRWIIFALGSAVFAAATAIFGKLGVNEINSNLATFIRTAIILIMVAVIITVRKEWQPVGKIPAFSIIMLAFSGIATGLSWLCYYRALQLGNASKVAPVDKLSVALVIIFAVIFLGEQFTWKLVIGGGAVIFGIIVLAI